MSTVRATPDVPKDVRFTPIVVICEEAEGAGGPCARIPPPRW